MLPGSRNVGHVFVQDVLLGADAVILDVFGPVQLTHVKVKCLGKQIQFKLRNTSLDPKGNSIKQNNVIIKSYDNKVRMKSYCFQNKDFI